MSDPRELETATQTRRAPATAPAPTAKPTRGDAVRKEQRRTDGHANQERLTAMLGPGPSLTPIFPSGTADRVAAQIKGAVRENSDLSQGAGALLRATELATSAYDGAGRWSDAAHQRVLCHGVLEGLGHGLWERRSAALEHDLTAYALLSAHGRAQQTVTASSLSLLGLAQRDHLGLELDLTHAGQRRVAPEVPEPTIDTRAVAAERRSFERGAEAIDRTDHRTSAPDDDQRLVEAFERLSSSGRSATAATLKARQLTLDARRREVMAEREADEKPKTLVAQVEAVLAGALSFAQSVAGFAESKTVSSTAALFQALGGTQALWPTRARQLDQEIRALQTLSTEVGAEAERQTILAAMDHFGMCFQHFADALEAAERARDGDQKRLRTVGSALDKEARKKGTLAPDREHMVAVGRRVARVDAARSSNTQARRALVYAQATAVPRSVDLIAKTIPRSGEVDIDGQRERIAKSDIFAATAAIFGGVVAELDTRATTLDQLAGERR